MINFDGRGRPGRLAKVTAGWADSVRDRSDPGGSVLILLELALDAARLADAARRDGNGSLYLSAATRLQQLMDRVDRGVGRDGVESAGGDDLAAELGSGPEVFDAEDA